MNEPLLTADAHVRREDAASTAPRPVVDVAVGVLIRADGRFLLASRPEGKVYAGYWEFPGGKLEKGESVEAALARELHEELGITVAVSAVQRWREQMVDYPHALVRLHFCQVREWQGELDMREGQSVAWEALPVAVSPVLPGAVPVLRWLQEAAAGT
jgi:8-oxo-dGTP diphosphatase